jgi:hypothetical protein
MTSKSSFNLRLHLTISCKGAKVCNRPNVVNSEFLIWVSDNILIFFVLVEDSHLFINHDNYYDCMAHRYRLISKYMVYDKCKKNVVFQSNSFYSTNK